MSVQEDKELQRFLEGDDPVSQAYRDLPRDEPPAALDALILESARDEARRPVRPRWFVPVSVAATVVLGVGFSVKQLSAPMESVSDIAYAPVAQEAADDTNLRPSPTGAPVPKPNLDDLFEDEAPAQVRMKRIDLDAVALREQALSSQTFNFEIDAGTLGRTQSSAPASNDDGGEFAAAPPVRQALPSPPRREHEATIAVQAEPAPAPPAAAEKSVNWESRQDNAQLARAIEDSRRRAKEQELALESSTSYSSARAPGPVSEPAAQFADEIDAVIVTGARAARKEAPATTREQALIDQQLNRIRRQWRLGRTEEAQVLFDAFIEDYPDHELPEDFPLQRPEPADTP